MGIRLNLEGVDTGFEPLADGLYAGTIASIEQRTSQAGNPTINMGIALAADPDRKVKAGRKVFTNFALVPQALWKLKQFLVRMGKDKSELEGEFDFEPSEFIGREVMVLLAQPREGSTYNEVKEVYGPEGPTSSRH